MGALTTHVLNTSTGQPGRAIRVQCLRDIPGAMPQRYPDTVTDGDGRAQLVAAEAMTPGVYEITFHVAEYFATLGLALPDPPFLDRVTLRIGVADAGVKTHVPLLVSPWSYATYRGS